MSSPKKVASPVIGYVHKLSNLKQGKKTPWCDMELQMKGDVRKRVVCFSKAKRDIFKTNQETYSAVRISNYVVSKGLTGDSEHILKIGTLCVHVSAQCALCLVSKEL